MLIRSFFQTLYNLIVKKLFYITLFILALALFLAFASPFFPNKAMAPIRGQVSIGTAHIDVEIAQTQAQLIRGLSGRENVDGGMWFIFPKDDYYGIWMKEMFFPLDIIWVGNDFRIVHIEENVSPTSFPRVFKPASKARYVLEVPAGFVAQHGVKNGVMTEFLKK